MAKPKILLFDLETAPNTAYVWSLWNEVRSMEFVTNNWYVLCWCAKWFGKKEVMSSALIDYTKSEDDKKVMQALWKLLDEADIVVAHNAKKFDCRRVNARFISHDITPPSPYRVVDTLLEARSQFFFTSNRLNDLGEFLKLGKKMDTGGFKLWKKCMKWDMQAWDKMVRYCKKDVILLERVYKKLLPYMKSHPNVAVYTDKAKPSCNTCGSTKVHFRGYSYTNASKFKRFVCTICGRWGRESTNKLDNKVSRKI